VQDDERRKIARDLHDSTGQTLAALKISISFLQAAYRLDASTLAAVSDIASLADRAIEEIRTMSYLLHPPLLDEVGFNCAAQWFVEGFSKRSGINVKLHLEPTRDRLPMRIEIVLFRVLQESLTNVHRHSESRKVDITIRFDGGEALVTIRDYGRGFTSQQLRDVRSGRSGGVGLTGLRERIGVLGGLLEIVSMDPGALIKVTLPLAREGTTTRVDD